jgi:hypothetical protein
VTRSADLSEVARARIDAADRGAVSSGGETIARWLMRSFSVIAPGWRGVIFPSGSARGRCSGSTVLPYAARGRFAKKLSIHWGRRKGKEVPTPLHSNYIAHGGACGKTRVVPHHRRPKHEHLRNGRHEMRVLLSTYASRGDVEPMVGRLKNVVRRCCAA